MSNCEPEHLLQFGIMCSELVSSVEGKPRPTVGLLNIGDEDIKGNELVKRAAELMRASGLNFHGYVEGDDIYKGTTDVVVCDGFVGNVALKTSEGLAQMLATYLREEFGRNLVHQTGRAGGAARDQCFQEPRRSSPLQRREPARAARHRGQEPWLGRRIRIRIRHPARDSRRRAPACWPTSPSAWRRSTRARRE